MREVILNSLTDYDEFINVNFDEKRETYPLKRT